jgi:endoglucanase
MKASHRWLVDLTHLPTTSGHEDRVVEWIEAWVRRRDDLRLRTDRAGNLLITIKGRKRRDPVIAAAHMDHPGWVIEGIDATSVRARFMGGVMGPYFESAPVVFFTASGAEVRGIVAGFEGRIGSIRLTTGAGDLASGDVGRWRFDKRTLGVRGDLLRAPACDDLAGVAAALAALDEARKKPALNHYGVLLTRAEEAGLLGAIAACELGTIPDRARVLSIETSRSFTDSPIGGGPVVRVGDRSSIFDSELTNQVAEAVRAAGITHQRKLMAGGTCEATAFVAYGHRSTGLCLPLGNYHNMIDIDGVAAGTAPAKLGPEEISLSDFDGLVDLMLVAASDIDADAVTLHDRLAASYAERKGLLGL